MTFNAILYTIKIWFLKPFKESFSSGRYFIMNSVVLAKNDISTIRNVYHVCNLIIAIPENLLV